MAGYLERELVRVMAEVKTNLNTVIAAINVENDGEADAVVLGTIDSSAFYFQDWGPETPNFDPCVLFDLAVDVVESRGGQSSETVRLLIALVSSDRGYGNSEKLLRLHLRYRQAVRKVVLDLYPDLPGHKLTDLPTVPFVIEGREGYLYQIGVGLSFTLAG